MGLRKKSYWLGGIIKISLPKWFLIAQNEYNLRLSRIRKIRSIFPFLLIGFLVFYVSYLAPLIANLFLDDLLAFLLSELALAMVPVLLFLAFFYLLIIPITYTLQSMEAGQVEIFLAAPIKSSDVLLGEFLGALPFYGTFIVLLSGLLTAVLIPLGLDLLQIFIVVFVMLLVFLSAIWIGTVSAGFIQTRFAKSAKGKDLGRALSLVIALPLVGAMYAIIGGGFTQALSDPLTNSLTRQILSFLPSSWGSDVILDFAANPGNIGAVWFETFARVGGLVLFFVLALWLGTKLSARIYSIEPTSFVSSKVKPDGIFYKTIRGIGGGGSFGRVLVLVFKDYARRLENLSRLVYVLGLLALINLFLVEPSGDPGDALIMGVFLFAFLAVLVVGQITVGGKESVFIHKKAPSGIGRLLKARLLQSLLVAVPIGFVVTLISLLRVPGIAFLDLLLYGVLMSQLVAGNVTLALGVALINPEFSENPRTQMMGLMLNAQAVLFTSIGVFIASQILFNLDFIYTFLVQSIFVWILGVVCLQIGKSKLDRIE